MSEHWKIEDRGPTSDAAALEAMTYRCDCGSAPSQFVCTNQKTGKIITVTAKDRWEALEMVRREEVAQQQATCEVG